MKFGLKNSKKLTGAELYVRASELIAILPAVYIFLISGYPAVISKYGVFTVLFDYGASCLPSGFMLFCSWVFRLTQNEIVLSFSILVPMLAFGLLMGRLLPGKRRTAVVTRLVLAVLILADLIVRLLPLSLNSAFGTAPAVVGFAVRAAFLALVVLDLVFARREKQEAQQAS